MDIDIPNASDCDKIMLHTALSPFSSRLDELPDCHDGFLYHIYLSMPSRVIIITRRNDRFHQRIIPGWIGLIMYNKLKLTIRTILDSTDEQLERMYLLYALSRY
jgi:hypothetical protein